MKDFKHYAVVDSYSDGRTSVSFLEYDEAVEMFGLALRHIRSGVMKGCKIMHGAKTLCEDGVHNEPPASPTERSVYAGYRGESHESF